jgi:hypothetical protein
VPDVEEEDARRPHRELARLTKERVGHVNRIKGLLALHGVWDYRPLRRDRREALAKLETGYGRPLPPRFVQEIERELSRLEMVLRRISDVEQAMAEPVAMEQLAADSARGQPELKRYDPAAALEKLSCIGRETAVVLAREVLCRDFRDRRSLAAFSGLKTRLGTLDLKVPKLRAGPDYFPPFLEPRKTLPQPLAQRRTRDTEPTTDSIGVPELAPGPDPLLPEADGTLRLLLPLLR